MSFFSFRTGKFPLGNKKYIMGIVNITPDSFSDGGRYLTKGAAVEHALSLIEDSADIIDLGAMSTKPFSQPITPKEEQNRLLPVLKELKKKTTVPISVDTVFPETVYAAICEGADIVNDVSGVFVPETAEYVKENACGYIVMHGGVKCSPSQTLCDYPMGIVNHVQMFFDEIYSRLIDFGFNREYICLDPGFGFMKNTAQNTELLKNLSLLDTQGVALMSALSRKRFVGELSQDDNAEDRLGGTLAANIASVYGGADIIRTHEVAIHRKALNLIENII